MSGPAESAAGQTAPASHSAGSHGHGHGHGHGAGGFDLLKRATQAMMSSR